MRVSRVHKATGLLHEHIFGEVAVEERIGYVKLTNAPIEVNSNGENHTDGSGFDDWTEGLSEVNTTALIEAFCNEACFEPLNRAILPTLNFVDPLVADDVVMPGARAEGPSTIGKEGIKFLAHSSTPIRGGGSLRVTGWLSRGDDSGKGLKRMASGVKEVIIREVFGF